MAQKRYTWDAADKVSCWRYVARLARFFGTSVSVKNITAGIYFNYQFGAKYYNQTLADSVGECGSHL